MVLAALELFVLGHLLVGFKGGGNLPNEGEIRDFRVRSGCKLWTQEVAGEMSRVGWKLRACMRME